ncbi:nuclear transport factor 2 family protein [Aureisphaera galaxeae]|uniref:nuclear transport factor 2 family protein n=1 Tax=Aureisphaera galaxeae TaxID=1538023 RepID=UPI002350B0B7|nr:nuclear transport factor 2 family protein [Aureisphaera galaxeae]MDC8003221.1 nuclear transport factor 2 family protein [Aureisphaera galaxeae]
MKSKELVREWFEVWKRGDFHNIPISEDFKHTSPYGTIDGKKAYMDLVESNRDKFLGYEFVIHEGLYETDRACVRYTALQGDFRLEVSEWYVFENDRIKEIIAYYNIEGEISEGRKLKNLDN